MSQHFSFPEIPKVNQDDLEKEWEKDYAIGIAINTLRCMLLAVATTISADEPNQKSNNIKWRIVLGHINKTIKLGFSLIEISRLKKHREGINQLALQIANVAIQAMWLIQATNEDVESYISNSLISEKENYDRIQKHGSSEQKEYLSRHFPKIFEDAGLNIHTFTPKFRVQPSVSEMFNVLNLDKKCRAIYDILGFHQSHTSYMDIVSFYIEEHEGKYLASDEQSPPKPYYISGTCLFLCELIRGYIDLAFTNKEFKDELKKYFKEYEEWVTDFNEFTMFRPFNTPIDSPQELPKKKATFESPISAHKLVKKKLVAPANEINFTFNSWLHDRMPEMLWALCLIHGMGRAYALDLFRKIINLFMNKKDCSGEITFSGISQLDRETKEKIFSIFKTTPGSIKFLSNLKVITNIPGLNDWPLEEVASSNEAWNFLAHTMLLGIDHQSQESTDCKWLKVACRVAVGKLHLGDKTRYEEIFYYPDVGDQKSVRPFIRSSELTLSSVLNDKSKSKSAWMEKFWEECYKNTDCFIAENGVPTQKIKPSKLSPDILRKLFYKMQRSYRNTIPNTRADAKHEVFWGLALYTVGLSVQILEYADDDVLGVLGLRSVAESILNLNYLVKKNESSLWQKFRDYGVGKAKLTLLKAESDLNPPHYIPVEKLKLISNEDKWQEFVDINLGDWSGENLRDRAVNYGCKELYDNYYEWPSSFSHGQWSAIRFLVFENCINPLHRFHRMPQIPGAVKTVRYDVEILINLLLDIILLKEYPSVDLDPLDKIVKET